MLNQIVINDDDIKQTEKTLLQKGENFDDEQKQCIKNTATIDIQACPGSGKTTCLLAKLLTIEKYLPFENGRGILVLSHTNTAVNKIRGKILNYCPRLFDYPNFVSTIQVFIDHFLAIPFYQQQYGHLPYRIDDEIYNEKIWIPTNVKYWFDHIIKGGSHLTGESIVKSLRFDPSGKLISALNIALPKEETSTYKALYKMKTQLLKDGYLCFHDAYYLGECYVKSFSKIINLIQERFSSVFIDEMQDTDTSQMSLINKLFPVDGKTIVQRMGDQNQAIYSSVVSATNVWIPRVGYLTLNGSKRFSQSIAHAIKSISLTPQELRGNASKKSIKPKIILFDNLTIRNVPNKFGELIVAANLHKKRGAIFKAIGWRKTENKGFCIGSYFDNFQYLKVKDKIDFDNFDQYLRIDLCDINMYGLSVPRKNILNAIIKTLRIAKIKTDQNNYFTISSFLRWLNERYSEEYVVLKRNLYKWSISIYRGEDVFNEIKGYVLKLLSEVFTVDYKSINFGHFFDITGSSISTSKTQKNNPTTNMYQYRCSGVQFNIEVGTIHSVKGETHTATLYLETYYYNDGGKSYESQRLIEQLKGNCLNSCGVRVKESQKMAYVGMSRPTDLLCFAAHKSHIPDTEILGLQNNWEIVDITQN